MNKLNCFFILLISLLSFQLTYASVETPSGAQENTANCLLTFRVQNSELNVRPEDITSVDYNRSESYVYQDIYNDDSKINGVSMELSQQAAEDFILMSGNNIDQVMQTLWCEQIIGQATIKSALGKRMSIWLDPKSAKAFYHWAYTPHD